MRTVFLFCLLLGVISCSYDVNTKIEKNESKEKEMKPIRDDCINTNGYKVFQVFDFGVLAYECDKSSDKSSYCYGKIVLLPNSSQYENIMMI